MKNTMARRTAIKTRVAKSFGFQKSKKISSSIAMPIIRYGWSRTIAKEPEILPIISECSTRVCPFSLQRAVWSS